ncbi:phage tail sheath subtilisin-like domain-containing protein [Vibrio ruber]|uniref:phage tail sheath subtilisin-like domain-containing protein n=1 Tax=Vibrio ruber TaxID=184755 RepID=UPI002892E369|nr:phage tail sheath subtilisin-like domain-containing protein [Vibrio ruber]WNJ96539.1 phage tail sheath subtilisin-like domain-containing protein [Vibrio ruber]
MSDIPTDIRVPLFYMEFDNSLAVSGTPAMVHKILVVGQMGADAVAAQLEQHTITSDNGARQMFGDSILTDMLLRLRKANNYTETVAMGIEDLTDGAAASADGFTFSGTAMASGTCYLMIGGKPVQVGVSEGDTAADIAASVIAKITTLNATLGSELRVTAQAGASTNIVKLTCKHKGITGNDIDLRINYYTGEQLPKGIICTVGTMSGGTGTPDMTAIVAAIGDEWFNHIVMPYNDQSSLNTLRDELIARWGPMRMQEAIAYTAFRGTHAETSTWGSTRNDYLITCMGTNKMPTPSWEVAASYAGTAAYYLAIDPAQPLQTLTLKGILPPAKGDQWDLTERNLHLHDGVATYFVDASNQVCIEREISTYQVNKFGSPDPSYLDITTPSTLGYLRYSMKAHITQNYPRHKLAGDDVLDELEPGQPVVTPKTLRVDFLDKFLEWEGKGLVEDFETFKSTLSVVRDNDNKNRVNVMCSPNLVNGFRILAATTQFQL